ncbi:MAG: DUF952 domain-containing protein [Rhizobiaceae bacterium]|nr:DUF952 domain-containing protein [Rhizobiaceae bacterium]
MTQKIYKILTPEQWNDALAQGTFKGAPIDLTDGYIHFSTADQVEETADKHFKNTGDLMLVAFDGDAFGDSLKWETSRGGALFPHLYLELDPKLAIEVYELAQKEDGSHQFPENY